LVVGDFGAHATPANDIITASSVGIAILSNNGDGSFAAPLRLTSSPNGSVMAADLNGDGKLDFATTEPNKVGVYQNSGAGNFRYLASEIAVFYSGGALRFPSVVALLDVDRDGNPDILTANSNGGNLSFLRGNGDGSFQPEVYSPAPATRSLAVA